MEAALQNEFINDLNRNAGILHRICRIYFEDTAERQDVLQEMIFQLWKSYPSFQAQSRVSTWMYRVALNTALTYLRKERSRIAPEPLREELLDMLRQEPSAKEEQTELLYKAINTLSLVDRAIILLHLEENSYEEMAAITGFSKSNISVRLVRIKRKLEEKLRQTKSDNDHEDF